VLRRSFRIGLLVGLLGGALAALARAIQGRVGGTAAPAAPAPWTPLPDAEPVRVPPRPAAPTPSAPATERPKVAIADLQESPAAPASTPAPVAAKKAPAAKKKAAPKPAPWVEPVDGECPPTHPIKAKMASGIYHVPGGFNYDRTRPDRCYRDTAAAEADGLRPSKR
jgi:hypothetical protein